MSGYFNASNFTINNQTETLIGGIAYFLVYLSEYLPYVILYSTGAVVGFIGILTPSISKWY